MEVTLDIRTPRGFKRVRLAGEHLTLGRGEQAAVRLDDEGLSRVHASVNRDGERVWVLDEGSTNGSYVNGVAVPPSGTPLKHGDEITLGGATTVLVNIGTAEAASEAAAPRGSAASDAFEDGARAGGGGSPSSAPVAAALAAAVLILVAAVAVGVRLSERGSDGVKRDAARNGEGANAAVERSTLSQETHASLTPETQTPVADTATPEVTGPAVGVTPPVVAEVPGANADGSRKLYLRMSEQERLDFIEDRARHVSMMMGNRPYAFNDDVLRYIKQYVDAYARRVGNNSTRLWGEDLRFMFARARERYSPHIVRAFNAQGVPPVVGIYLVVIETEYHNIRSENFAGAAGLFQFIGPTARGYGVDPAERTNVAKMAPAAAAYMADRIAEFGPDSMSVALAIAGYNRSPDSVRRDLHDVLNSENKERSFWTLVANSNKLDHYFQGENIKYVPKFFAAAIVGENPWAFGLDMQPLSTYTEIKNAPETEAGGR
jgi:hypothetical protein